MKEILPFGIRVEDTEIWFQDETRIGQQGSLTRTWYYKGKRPRIVRQQQFLNAYIFGAVCPAKAKVSGFISPYCNAQAMQIHLNILAEEVEKHAVLVLDRAGWHVAKSLDIPKNITLLYLPAYSPELNPKENFWQSLKNRHLANRVFDSFDDIMDSCENAWREFTQNKEYFAQLCSRKWANII